ncbi:MAG: DUF6544 family protein [Salinivirgaceae bacterium]
MKNLQTAFIALHGFIHLIGFIKGWFPWQMPGENLAISKGSGILWLVTAGLFIAAAVAFHRVHAYWHILAVTGVILSLILVVVYWNYAKFGLIPNAIVVLFIVSALSACSLNKKIAEESKLVYAAAKQAQDEPITKDAIQHLPESVQKWLEISGVVGRHPINSVFLQQNFLMKLKPEQENWYRAEAKQLFSVHEPAFIWTVRVPMSSLITVRGRDRFYKGKGEMLMKMNSIIKLGNEKGSKMDEGTLQRFLGEIVWFPSAALSSYITWERVESNVAKATMKYGGTVGEGYFYFNDDGDIERYVANRYKGNDTDAQKYDWIVRIIDYKEFEGVRIPVEMDATWRLEEGDWTWCKITLTDVRYDVQPNQFNMSVK